MEKERELVIAALAARGVSQKKMMQHIAQFLAFQSIDRRLPLPDVTFDLRDLSKSRCIDRFRFTAPQIHALNLPDVVVSDQGVLVSGTTELCLVLRRLSYPCRYSYSYLSFEFGHQGSVMYSTFMKTLLMIHRRVAKKMAFDKRIFKEHANASALSVYNKVGYVDNCIERQALCPSQRVKRARVYKP